MVITELAKTKIQELLEKNKANFLNISLAGNDVDGFQTIITFENDYPMEFITITQTPTVLIKPIIYIKFANSILDFNEQANELTLRF